jgi:hypothetical protein
MSKATPYVLLGFLFAVWAVSIAGLAGVQSHCNANETVVANLTGIQGLSATSLSCIKLYGCARVVHPTNQSIG